MKSRYEHSAKHHTGRSKTRKRQNVFLLAAVCCILIAAAAGVRFIGQVSNLQDSFTAEDFAAKEYQHANITDESIKDNQSANIADDVINDSQSANITDDSIEDNQTSNITNNSVKEYQNTIAADDGWELILVNRWNPIPEQYEVELVQLSNGESVDERIYEPLQNMFDDARAQGVYPIVASGYRTAEKQQSLMDGKIQEYEAEGYSPEEAKEKAEAWVAIPGTSEHQLGIAVDINADGINSTGEEVYSWLEQNAHKYGFIYRYPADKTEITGVINEPWHYRYVGQETAGEICEQGICLEEYQMIQF